MIDHKELITGIVASLFVAIITGIWTWLIPWLKKKRSPRQLFISKQIEEDIESMNSFFVPNKISIAGHTYINGTNHFIDVLFQNEKNPFTLIIAPTGIGKTTFLANLYFEHKAKFKKKKNHHIAFGRMFDPDSTKIVKELIASGQSKHTILLMDALDEYLNTTKAETPKAYWDAFLKEYKTFVEETVRNFKKVMITVREQFMQTSELENIKIVVGLKNLAPLQVNLLPFGDEEQREYLIKRYGGLTVKKIDGIKWLAAKFRERNLDFIQIPLVLNYLDVLYEEYKNTVGENFKNNDFFFTSYNILTVIVNNWIKREVENKSITEAELLSFCKRLSIEIVHNNENTNNLYISGSKLFEIEQSIDVVKYFDGFGDRSLLIKEKSNETFLTEGSRDYKFRFIHEKFFEFFLALHLEDNPQNEKEIPLERYNFTIQLIVGKRWREEKKTTLPKHDRVLLEGEKNIVSIEKLQEWCDFFDGLTLNSKAKEKLSQRGFIKEILDIEDPNWRKSLIALKGLRITNQNFWDEKNSSLFFNLKKAMGYLQEFVEIILLRDLPVTDEDLSCFQGVNNVFALEVTNAKLMGVGLMNFIGSIKTLEELSLHSNQIEDRYLEAFEGTDKLTYLNFNQNKLTGKGLSNFAASAKTLMELHLSKNQIEDHYLSAFEGADKITKLVLSQNKLTGEGLSNFSGCAKTLTELALWENKIEDRYMKAFEGADKIILLGLGQNKLTGEGLYNFAGSVKTIIKLNLGENQIEDQYLHAFEGSDKITELNLSQNKLTGEGLSNFADSAKTITILRLQKNQIEDQYLSAFEGANKIIEIGLGQNKLTGEGLSYFAGSVKTITKLHLWVNQIEDQYLSAFEGADKISELALGINKLSGERLSCFAGSVKTITKLYLWGNEIEDQYLNAFQGADKISELTLNQNKLTGEGLINFSNCLETLKFLGLGEPGVNITPHICHFKECKDLEQLTITKGAIIGSDNDFKSWFPQLKKLTITGCIIENPDFIEQLREQGVEIIE